jgi:hypothetical protein
MNVYQKFVPLTDRSGQLDLESIEDGWFNMGYGILHSSSGSGIESTSLLTRDISMPSHAVVTKSVNSSLGSGPNFAARFSGWLIGSQWCLNPAIRRASPVEHSSSGR